MVDRLKAYKGDMRWQGGPVLLRTIKPPLPGCHSSGYPDGRGSSNNLSTHGLYDVKIALLCFVIQNAT